MVKPYFIVALFLISSFSGCVEDEPSLKEDVKHTENEEHKNETASEDKKEDLDIDIIPVDFDPDCSIVDPYPSTIFIDGNLTFGYNSFQFVARDNNTLNVYAYMATGYDPKTSPILFVMHGMGRTAESYLRITAPIAERYNALAIAPEFPNGTGLYGEETQNTEPYTLGVGIGGTPNTSDGSYNESEWRKPEDYLYSEVEHLFEAVKQMLGADICRYHIWGHSAGAQFVHRLLTFLPDARVERAVAANAGWYTLPRTGGPDNSDYWFPYGLTGTPLSDPDVGPMFEKRLTILLGLEDTVNSTDEVDNDGPRNSAQANTQGYNRLDRGNLYFAEAQWQAASMPSYEFNWNVAHVPHANHSSSKMVAWAGWYLFRDTDDCTPTGQSIKHDLIINEILADPPSSSSDSSVGDANNDNVRDPSDDEFIELVNNGNKELCLSGWAISDSDRIRTVFTPEVNLSPGEAVVVFGGGEPSGDFGGTIIQWALFGGSLSLSNAGDVITIIDYFGDTVRQVSWGTCGSIPCAQDNITYNLGIDMSVTRDPEFTGSWTNHTVVNPGTEFSPGTRADGTPF